MRLEQTPYMLVRKFFRSGKRCLYLGRMMRIIIHDEYTPVSCTYYVKSPLCPVITGKRPGYKFRPHPELMTARKRSGRIQYVVLARYAQFKGGKLLAVIYY